MNELRINIGENYVKLNSMSVTKYVDPSVIYVELNFPYDLKMKEFNEIVQYYIAIVNSIKPSN